MPKVFLCHSSKQKNYVETVAKTLGKTNIFYDAWSFEEGAKTIEEIYQGLTMIDIFTYFISDESLKSPWVKKEIDLAFEKFQNQSLQRFIPIIIDEKISHTDIRIPDWIKDNYNIRYVAKPTKASERIKQSLKTLVWNLYPHKKQFDQLFIGRTELIKTFEERIYDFDKGNPILMITSGLPSIGRRKFTTQCLKNSNKIREHYTPLKITLGSRDSIEDFIIRLYDLGYSNYDFSYVQNLSTKTISEKVNIAISLLNEMEKYDEMIYLVDDGCIVNVQGIIVDWFLLIIRGIKATTDRLYICLIAKGKVKPNQLLGDEEIFAIAVPELEKYERNALFKALIDIDEIQLKKDEFHKICNIFNGYPEQVLFTFNLLKYESKDYLINNLDQITDYNSQKVARIIAKYESTPMALQLMSLLSQFDFISISFLDEIFKEDSEIIKPILNSITNEMLIEFLGAGKEYIRLNDVIKDYIQRANFKLDIKYTNKIQAHVKNNFANYDTIERDASEYVISIKEALKNGYNIPAQFLIPSHFLNAMRDLYNLDRKYNDVILLANRVLQNEKFFDARILREIRYWLCLSLARKKDKRLLEEVQHINGIEHEFLIGFYYRIIGNFTAAIDRFMNVLDANSNAYRAKRELVQIYMNLDMFKEALSLARESYQQDKNNPYNLQSYFRCLLRLKGFQAKDELEVLLNNLKNNNHEKGKEMYLTALAHFYASVEGDQKKSISAIDEAAAVYPTNIYPPLAKLEILRRFDNWIEINETLNEIEKKFSSESDIFTKLTYLSTKYLWLVKSNKRYEAKHLLDSKIKYIFTKHVYEELRNIGEAYAH